MLGILLSLALLATPAFADHGHSQDDHAEEHHTGHDHEEDHLTETGGVRAIHAWTNATGATTTLVYVDLENTSDQTVILTGAQSEIAASAEWVGLTNSNGDLSFEPIPQLPIAAGTIIDLSPNALAIRLTGLRQKLVEGKTFEIEIAFSDLDLHAIVEVQSATQHSHAGHQH